MQNNNELVKLLLENGANPFDHAQRCRKSFIIDYSIWRTPIIIATLRNNLEMVKIILDSNNNANVNDRDMNFFIGQPLDDAYNATYMTPLIHASRYNYIEMTKLLLDRGANINNTDCCGLSALHWAILKQNTEIIKLLLEYNPNIHSKTYAYTYIYGVSPLELAIFKNNPQILQLFFQYSKKSQINLYSKMVKHLSIHIPNNSHRISNLESISLSIIFEKLLPLDKKDKKDPLVYEENDKKTNDLQHFTFNDYTNLSVQLQNPLPPQPQNNLVQAGQAVFPTYIYQPTFPATPPPYPISHIHPQIQTKSPYFDLIQFPFHHQYQLLYELKNPLT